MCRGRDWLRLKRPETVLAFAFFRHAIKYANEPETNPKTKSSVVSVFYFRFILDVRAA